MYVYCIRNLLLLTLKFSYIARQLLPLSCSYDQLSKYFNDTEDSQLILRPFKGITCLTTLNELHGSTSLSVCPISVLSGPCNIPIYIVDGFLYS